MTKIQPTQIEIATLKLIQTLIMGLDDIQRKQHSESIKRGLLAKKEREIVIRLACKAK